MRIAIVRLTSLGDLVHTLPVAHALRRHSPTSYIVWIVEEREQTLLLHNPAVDEVVVGPTRRWRRELRTPAGALGVLSEFRRLKDRLRSLSLDVAIDVQGLLKSAIFTVLTQAPVRIGFQWRYAREPLSSLFTTHRVTPPASAVHMVQKNLSLLEPLGIPVQEIAFPLPFVPAAEEKALALLQRYSVKPQDRLAVLIPATRRPTKQWPPSRYRELANRLTKKAGVRVLLLSGPGEEELLQVVAQGLDSRLIPVTATSIPELVAFLRRAHLAVGNDTGPLHLAAALGVPTIGLYGPTRPEWNGPYGPRVLALRSPTERIEDLSVDTVLQAVVEWLG
ncbi:MAG: lipopolysaccharide heptosyltransferase I [Candidatus Methylomirabilales bacterium]